MTQRIRCIDDLRHPDIKNGMNKLLQTFDLEQRYKKHLESQERDDRSGVWHPSAIGMCRRRNVYERTGTPGIKTVSAKSADIFALGHSIHDRIQGVLKDMEKSLQESGIQFRFRAEVPTPPDDALLNDLNIAGTCDGLLEVWIPGKWELRAVIEIKSIRDEGWKQLVGPLRSHRLQANLYAYRFDRPIIYYWYYNKNNSTPRVYTESFDPEAFEEAIRIYAELEEYVERNELPEREESYMFCGECPYRKTCDPEVLKTSYSKKMNSIGRFRNRTRK